MATISLYPACHHWASYGYCQYAAACVLQMVGNNSIQYILTMFVAETSSLRTRRLIHVLVRLPNLVVCWLIGSISARFHDGPGWPWPFGVSTILVRCSASPSCCTTTARLRRCHQRLARAHTALFFSQSFTLADSSMPSASFCCPPDLPSFFCRFVYTLSKASARYQSWPCQYSVLPFSSPL